MNPNPNDAKATVPLPGTAPQPERETLPLPSSPAAETAPGDARSTVPLPGDIPEAFPADGTDTRVLPTTIGRFAVRAWLGSGAFGDVYRAHDPQLDREVALKVAKPGSLDTPERLARFLREAKSAANLRHPNIVPLYETGRDGDRLFIASAFINGRTLEAVIAEANETGTPIPLDTAAGIARKLADALAYAHSQGIVHRDVKPANVMVDGAGEPPQRVGARERVGIDCRQLLPQLRQFVRRPRALIRGNQRHQFAQLVPHGPQVRFAPRVVEPLPDGALVERQPDDVPRAPVRVEDRAEHLAARIVGAAVEPVARGL